LKTFIYEHDKVVYNPETKTVTCKDEILWCPEHQGAWDELLNHRITSVKRRFIPTHQRDNHGIKKHREAAYDLCIGDEVAVATLPCDRFKDKIEEIQQLLDNRVQS